MLVFSGSFSIIYVKFGWQRLKEWNKTNKELNEFLHVLKTFFLILSNLVEKGYRNGTKQTKELDSLQKSLYYIFLKIYSSYILNFITFQIFLKCLWEKTTNEILSLKQIVVLEIRQSMTKFCTNIFTVNLKP